MLQEHHISGGLTEARLAKTSASLLHHGFGHAELKEITGAIKRAPQRHSLSLIDRYPLSKTRSLRTRDTGRNELNVVVTQLRKLFSKMDLRWYVWTLSGSTSFMKHLPSTAFNAVATNAKAS